MNYIITMQKTVYVRTESGKSWKKKPVSVEKKVIDRRFYENYINSVHFFNNFGYGSSCRAYYGYTYAGYIPVSVVTISPFKEERHVVRFSFEIVH